MMRGQERAPLDEKTAAEKFRDRSALRAAEYMSPGEVYLALSSQIAELKELIKRAPN